MRKMLTIVVLLAGACAFSALDKELPKFAGQHIDSLVRQLGFPNAEQTIMGRKVYTWRSDMSYTSITPASTTSTGYVGTRMAPVTLTSTSYVPTTSNLACTIRAVVSARNIIESVAYEGNNGACLSYSSRLKAPDVNAPTSALAGDLGPQVTCRFPGSTELHRISTRSCTESGGTVVRVP